MQTRVERPEIAITDELRGRFEAKILKTETCWIWKGAVDRTGYGAVKHDNVKYNAHVLSWRIANNGIAVPIGKLIMHSCDCRLCVNPEHLEVGTSSQNRKDSIERHGTVTGHVLTDQDVIAIRDLFAKGALKSDLARKFGVSRKTIHLIVTRQSWKHL